MHWLDRLYAAAVGRPRFFQGGWGDLGAAGELFEFVRTPREPAPIRTVVRRIADISGLHAYEGSFKSPSAGLPRESRRAYFELLLPPDRADAPVCVYLAATGEEDGSRRRRLALPLVRMGIGALLLDNPFYGRRRPAGQVGSDLRRVADQFAMNRATIEEARALLGWLRTQGHTHVGVSGYSMGGSRAPPSPLGRLDPALGEHWARGRHHHPCCCPPARYRRRLRAQRAFVVDRAGVP